MQDVKKKSITTGAVLLFAIVYYEIASLLFSPGIQKSDTELKEKMQARSEYEGLLNRKDDLESEWRAKEAFLSQSAQPEEAQNAWVKKILDYAQSQGLVFEKIEPQGAKEKDGRKEIHLFLYFHTDIRKFSEFLFYLKENEPFTGIETLLLKPEEDSKTLAFELVLKKVLA